MKLPEVISMSFILICSSVVICAQSATRPPLERLPQMILKGKALPLSEGVRVGDILYLSGQIGFDKDDTLPPGIEAQSRRVMERIGATLKSAGLDWKAVFRCTVMLENMADWPAFNRIYATYFSADHLPARSAFGTDGLALGALIEVQCDAYAAQ